MSMKDKAARWASEIHEVAAQLAQLRADRAAAKEAWRAVVGASPKDPAAWRDACVAWDRAKEAVAAYEAYYVQILEQIVGEVLDEAGVNEPKKK